MAAIAAAGRSRLLLGVALALTLLVPLAAALMAVVIVEQASPSCGAGAGGPPSAAAGTAIPAGLMPIYRAAEREYSVPWNVLAAINKIETDFGRNLAVSSAGAVGWMQFVPATWARYGVDADHDGRKDPYEPADAIFAAANYLRAAGAPGDLEGAIFAYNHADWYVRDVLAWADAFAEHPVALGAGGALAACGAGASRVPGTVRIAPGANLPGRPIAAETLSFLARVAGIYGRPLIVTTGTNHSQYTVDGNVSDHYDGYAADIGMAVNGGTDDSPVGDRIMSACLIAAGEPPARAAAFARKGGLFTLEHDELRIQCIWKTDLGGNHHNHVHIGARPTGT
jgi:Transglycosylase SLT domain